jgi:hypothetical protein
VKKRNLAVLAIIFSLTSFARPEMRARVGEAIAVSYAAQDEVRAVTGGATISVTGSYSTVFDGIVTYLKKGGYTVDAADKDTGLVATSMEINGSHGKRLVFSVLNDTSDHTLVRVAVSIQKGHKGAWGDPTVDDKASTELADKVQNDLLAQLGHN